MGTEEVKIIAASLVQFPQIFVISETQVSMNKGIPPREYRPTIRATHVIICGVRLGARGQAVTAQIRMEIRDASKTSGPTTRMIGHPRGLFSER